MLLIPRRNFVRAIESIFGSCPPLCSLPSSLLPPYINKTPCICAYPNANLYLRAYSPWPFAAISRSVAHNTRITVFKCAACAQTSLPKPCICTISMMARAILALPSARLSILFQQFFSFVYVFLIIFCFMPVSCGVNECIFSYLPIKLLCFMATLQPL